MKKFAVVLAGCGVYDGAEIHEAVLTLLAIEKNGASYEIFAPDKDQHHVINHLTGEEMPERRNVLTESARIARGRISDLAGFVPADFDALIFPGGFGVAKNLCSFAFDGAECSVTPEVEKAIREMHALKKPVGALCISPILLARLVPEARLSIGNDPSTADAINSMGAEHVITGHGEVAVDTHNLFFSTPCYMLDAGIAQITEGADNIIKEMLKHIK